MEIILPTELCDGEKFLNCASQIHYDEFSAKKFIFYIESSDVDVYELIGDDRLISLLYGWEVCSIHSRNAITEEMCHVVKVLAHYTLEIWFSHEWISCSPCLKMMLLHFIKKAANAFANIEMLAEINWEYLLKFEINPWKVPYLQKIFAQLIQNKQHTIEHLIKEADNEDITYLNQEALHLILLRLIKLFDAGSWEAVKQLSLRVLAAWLKFNADSDYETLQKDKTGITLIGHLYLLAIFVADDNRGYAIDNIIFNIRFYMQGMKDVKNQKIIHYTPARLIAHVCVHLGLDKNGFFEQIIFKKFRLGLVTSFAVILDAYTAYLLGNQLMVLTNLNQQDFNANLAQFKLLMCRYIKERENSEIFLHNEIKKVAAQKNSHVPPNTVDLNLNYQQQICKGNRASNIGNYTNFEDDPPPAPGIDDERDRQTDPVFQKIPEDYDVLEFVYAVLAERKYSGWQFAKIVLLIKLIGHQLNKIGTWRYHPGLTTKFMLNLENKLAGHYAALAKVLSEYMFMEAEFWLTAFYLNPTSDFYNEVKRCSRLKRKRTNKDEEVAAPPTRSDRRPDISHSIKIELLSSTIDVQDIVQNTNHNEPSIDYEPLRNALQSLRLPRGVIKDLLTVVFEPRNKRYSWALEWKTLHERCGALLKSKDLKKKFVALNMAEANDKLKFLKIDYEKYKNRPQLDYGSIEEGYENAASTADTSLEDNENSEDATEVQKPKRKVRKYWDEVLTEDEEEESESDKSETYGAESGTGRRTRIRAAAVVANAMISDMDRCMRSARCWPSATVSASDIKNEIDADDIEEDEKSLNAPPEEIVREKRKFSEVLSASKRYCNETNGFAAFADIWNIEKADLKSIESDENILLQSRPVLSKVRNWKQMKQNFDNSNQAAPIEAPRSSNAINNNNNTHCQQLDLSATNNSDSIPINGDNSDSFVAAIKTEHRSPIGTPNVKVEQSDVNESIEEEQTTPDMQTQSPTDLSTQVLTQHDIVEIKAENESIIASARVEIDTQSISKEVQLSNSCLISPTDKTSDINVPVPSELLHESQTFISEIPAEASTNCSEPHVKSPLLAKIEVKIENETTIEEMEICQEIELITNDQNAGELTTEQTQCFCAAPPSTSPLLTNLNTLVEENQSNEPVLQVNDILPKDEDDIGRQIRECLTRPSMVYLEKLSSLDIERLTSQDVEKMRRVCVRLKRTNFRNYYRKHLLRKCGISSDFKVNSNTEDSSTSTSAKKAGPPRSGRGRKPFKKFIHITSDSGPILPKQNYIRFHHITSDSSTSTDPDERTHSARSPAPRRQRGRRGPRGPTRNSNHVAKKSRVESIKTREAISSNSSDIIELSSTSSASQSPVPSTSINHFAPIINPLELDPLYEEEIVPYR